MRWLLAIVAVIFAIAITDGIVNGPKRDAYCASVNGRVYSIANHDNMCLTTDGRLLPIPYEALR